MTIINYVANYAPTAMQTGTKLQTNTANAALFQSMLQSHQTNSTFGIGSVGTKFIIAPPMQTSAVQSTSANIPESWCISDYYKLPWEELIPACLELRQEIADTDFTGMTDIEIFDYIENRFKDTFGDDFMMACQLQMLDPNFDNSWEISCSTYQFVGMEYLNAIHKYVGEKHIDNNLGVTGNTFTIVNRERLYPGMEMDEIMDTIRAKYPSNGRLTNRDVCLMTYEMWMVGAPCYFGLTPREVVSTYGANGAIIYEPQGEELEKSWKEYLDKPFNIALHNSFNNHRMLSMQTRGDYCESVPGQREFLIKYLGATVGPDGFLLPREWEPIDMGDISLNFDITVPDLLDEFMKHLDEHYRELVEKREGRNSDNRDNDLAEHLRGEDSLTQNIGANDIGVV